VDNQAGHQEAVTAPGTGRRQLLPQDNGTRTRRFDTWCVHKIHILLLWVLVHVLAAPGCVRRDPEPFTPPRPFFDFGHPRTRERAPDPYPERRILDTREETPPQMLARIEEIFRSIARIGGTEPQWRRAELEAEIDSIRADLAELGIGAGTLLRERLGRLNDEEAEVFRRAAVLYMRWGFALLRSGEQNERVWAGDRFRQARQWDPGNELLALVMSHYHELGGYWFNAADLLDTFVGSHGESELINLYRLRRRERSWKVTHTRKELDRAFDICNAMADNRGGWEDSPAWLNLERARLLLLADSTRSAKNSALLARQRLGTPPSDTLTSAQVELLLGVTATRLLEYEEATERLQRAMELASLRPSLAGLASWMSVPWDLWTMERQAQYSRSRNQRAFVDRFWSDNDPILATPDLLENRTEYWRRIGEAWFRLSGVDLALPGPLTPAGSILLRFGMPLEWTSTAGEETPGAARASGLRYAVNRSWRLSYRFHEKSADRPVTILLQDRGSGSRFSPVDSLHGPHWPPHVFSYGFEGRSYRLHTSVSRFRQYDGRTRLLVAFDTHLPNYSVRYPFQGLRFEGDAHVRAALYRRHGRTLIDFKEIVTVLGNESVQMREWEFRRRSSAVQIPDLSDGPVRLASMLTLRDREERIAGIAVDNGEYARLEGFGWDELQASDLLLLEEMEHDAPDLEERIIRPGLVVHGPDLDDQSFRPRASRVYLPGESISFYVEAYNLDTRMGVAEVELQTSLERLRPDGRPEYSVTIRGLSQTMVRFGINQWNVARSMGIGHLEPGLYRLRVAFFDRRASRRVERFAQFRLLSPQEMADFYRWSELKLPE